jgi:hypothetical protein
VGDRGSEGVTHRYLFIHVMKTGGTSLVLHLLKEFEPRAVYPDAALDRRGPEDFAPYAALRDLEALSPERRAEIRVYAGHFPYVARDLIGPDVRTLTLLREPVERTVSVLKHFKRLRDRYRDLSLDAIYDDPVVFPFFIENHQTKVFAVTPADRPNAFASALTYDEIRDRLDIAGHADTTVASDVPDTIAVDEARLAQAKTNLAAVDVIGCDETFHAFVEDLRDRFGWWSAGIDDGPRANVSSERWEAGSALRTRIAADNRFDLELYEHARELMRQRRS